MKGNKRKLEVEMKKSFEGLRLLTCQQKGITLIALIITIIVMLILVGVTINVALNGGIFTHAQTAAEETQKEAEREQLLSAVMGAIGKDAKVDFSKLDSNLPKDWTGSNGTYTSPKGNVFTVDANGNISEESENGGTSEEDNIVPDELKKYILGANELGRIMFELDEAGNQIDGILDFEEIIFLDDPLTEDVDETQTLGIECLLEGYNEDATKIFVYAKYNNKAYRITANETIKEKNMKQKN